MTTQGQVLDDKGVVDQALTTASREDVADLVGEHISPGQGGLLQFVGVIDEVFDVGLEWEANQLVFEASDLLGKGEKVFLELGRDQFVQRLQQASLGCLL